MKKSYLRESVNYKNEDEDGSVNTSFSISSETFHDYDDFEYKQRSESTFRAFIIGQMSFLFKSKHKSYFQK